MKDSRLLSAGNKRDGVSSPLRWRQRDGETAAKGWRDGVSLSLRRRLRFEENLVFFLKGSKIFL